MPETQSGTSFIPKRNPKKPVKRNSPRPVFIGTIIVRIFFFAVLIAALAVFTYERKLERDYDAEVLALNNAINSFSESDWQKVLEIDTRLYQAKQRLDNTVSVTSIFDALEASTISTVTINNFELKRVDDSTLSINSEMTTDSFDSVIFQREVLKANDKLSVADVHELELSNGQSNQNQTNGETSVKFIAELNVNPDTVRHLPVGQRNNANTIPVEAPLPSDESVIDGDIGISEGAELGVGAEEGAGISEEITNQ